MNYKKEFNKNGYNLKLFKELDSTNSYILRDYQNLNHKDVIIAKKQTAGKGRGERTWVSEKNQSLSMSIVLKYDNLDDVNLNEISTLTLVTGLAVLKSLVGFIKKEDEKHLGLKWVNDIVYKGKKLGGILIESKLLKNSVVFSVGIGLNLNQEEEFFIKNNLQYGISLRNITKNHNNKQYKINDISLKIIENFEIYYNKFIKCGFKSMRDEYKSFCVNLFKKAEVSYLNQKLLGIVKDVDESGALLLILDEQVDGKKEIVISTGEASIRGVKGYY